MSFHLAAATVNLVLLAYSSFNLCFGPVRWFCKYCM